MSADSNQDRRELLKNALTAIENLKGRIRTLEAAAAEGAVAEPIAIVGASCRFPGGANGLDAYWDILRDGRDVVAEIPASRWATVGDANADPGWHASLVDNIDGFEPRFFGISAREATTMDPQQRMVLEVGWEALESAGIAPDRLVGSRTGMFLGITGHDYADLLQEAGGLVDVYAATGNANNAAAGRFSFLLGLQGPSVAVDTACSSSLVAIHLACQSLRAGDCDMAVAGGVNALLTSGPFVCFRSWGMMASDGHCKTFDARADGFVRGEGCGLIVLKRLSDARAAGDRILAVIRGSAVNQDGRSSGLTVPNGPAQEEAIRRALEVARLAPTDISFVEAHGTGTSLGDPIEAHALAAVYGEGRAADNPLVLGSVKTNMGHLESAAGVAGLLKVVLSLQHEHIPAHLHFTQLNPDIDFNDVPVEIPVDGKRWARGERQRFAGVSSFGFSGTNAHVVLGEAPVREEVTPATERPAHLLTLSARTEAARDALAERFVQVLRGENGAALADVCYTANTGRTLHSERIAVVGSTREEVADALAARRWIGAQTKAGRAAKLAFLFTGQGSQWAGMGRELYDTQPIFRQALDRCATILDGVLNVPLLELLYGAQTARLDETAYTQPALFALEWAVSELWRSWGVKPTAVFGHSVGEYVALTVAGVWTLDDGLKLIAERGRLMQGLGAGWGMTSLRAPREIGEAAIVGYEKFVSIAAANAPEATVLSGRLDELAQVEAKLASQGVEVKRLTVSHAFHSPQMDAIADQFARRAASLDFRTPTARVISSVTGREIPVADLRQSEYWHRQVRDAVEFNTAMNTLAEAGFETFVEVGPTSTLSSLGRQCIGREGQVWAASLRKDRGATQQILESLGALHVHGVDVDLAALDASFRRKRVALPTYPFQRQRYWIDQAPRAGVRRSRRAGHPLLGARFTLAGASETYAWESDVNFERLPYLADHCVQGGAVVPATAYLEMAVAAGHDVLGDGPIKVTDADFFKPLFLTPSATARVQVRYEQGTVRVHSRLGETAPWVLHAVCHVERADPAEAAQQPAGFESSAREEIAGDAFYALFHERGNQWGPTFQGVQHAWIAENEGWSHVTIPEPLRAEMDRYYFHPAVADATGHILAAVTAPASKVAGGGAFVGQGIERVTIYDRPRGTRLFAHARVTDTDDPMVRRGDVRVFDEEGRLVSSLNGARLRYLEFGHDEVPQARVEDWFYGVAWRETSFAEAVDPNVVGDWLIVAADAQREFANAIVAEMRADGVAADLAVEGRAIRDALSRRRAGVLYLGGLAVRDDNAGVESCVRDLLELVRSMSARSDTRLWIATAGVHPVATPTSARGVWQAPLWGIGRTLSVENPELFGGLVDLDDDTVASAKTLWKHLRATTGEDQVALRDGRRFAARLERLAAPPRTAPAVRPDATYVITGGLGGLGLESARWLVQAGARRLMLLGRTALPSRAEWRDLAADHPQAAAIAAVRELEAAGTSVQTVAIDIADAAALARLFDTYEREGWPPIRGVVHTAGVLHHATLLDLDAKDLATVLRPKLGAWTLDRALERAPLDFFVLFSSASALLSSPKLGAYAAANCFLDAFADWRRAQGRPTLSVDWGVWGEAGMASRFDAESVRALGERGMGAMRTDEGFDALGRLMASDRAHAAVLPVNWKRWAELYPSYTASPLLTDVMVQRESSDGRSAAADRPLGLLEGPPEERPTRVSAHLASTLGAILGFGDAEVDVDISISALGLDSLTAVEFKNRIAATVGVALPTVRLLQGPTISELAAELASMLEQAAPRSAEAIIADAIAAQVEALTDEEVDAALRELIGSGALL